MLRYWIFFLWFPLLLGAQELPDPKDEGWDSEALSERIQERLKKIIASVAGGGEPPPGYVAPGAKVAAGETLDDLRNDKLVHTRTLETSSALVPFAQAFPAFIGQGEIRYKIKVSRIKLADGEAEARILYFSSRETPGGAEQTNSVWDTLWDTGKNADLPVLQSVQVISHEKTLLKSSAPWFADATAAVFGGDPAFHDHVSVGTNHWLNRVERFAGSNIYSRHGMAMGDANGDGLDDLYLCQPGGLPNRLFVNQGDGTLRDGTAKAGLDWLNDTRSALFLDLDNDGDQDLVLGTFVGVFLCQNNGRGVFESVASLTPVGRDVSSLAAADYDQDGFVDLYVCVYESEARLKGEDDSGHSVYDLKAKGGTNRLFRNRLGEAEGRWEFEDVTEKTGMDAANGRFTLAAAWDDYDNDGDQDLYLANDFGFNCLYRNTGGTFVEVSEQLGVQDYSPGMSATWGDLNRDGKFDLYVGNMFSSAGNRVTRQEQFTFDYEGVTLERLHRFNRGNSLYVNTGEGFREEPDGLGAQNALWAWSSLFGDIDNDGWEDILCANGYITGTGPGDL